MLPKTNTYVKAYDRQTKWMYFLTEDDDLLTFILFGIISVLISEKNLIVSLSIINIF